MPGLLRDTSAIILDSDALHLPGDDWTIDEVGWTRDSHGGGAGSRMVSLFGLAFVARQ